MFRRINILFNSVAALSLIACNNPSTVTDKANTKAQGSIVAAGGNDDASSVVYDSLYSRESLAEQETEDTFQVLNQKIDYILDGDGSISIHFPQLIGLKNTKVETAINKEVQKSLNIPGAEFYDAYVAEHWLYILGKHTITYRNHGIVSFCYDLVQNGGGSRTSYNKIGFIFDLSTGRRLKAKDIFKGNNNEEIARNFHQATGFMIDIDPSFIESMVLTNKGFEFTAIIEGPYYSSDEKQAKAIPLEKLEPVMTSRFKELLKDD